MVVGFVTLGWEWEESFVKRVSWGRREKHREKRELACGKWWVEGNGVHVPVLFFFFPIFVFFN
jgi:hypothetical protein